MHPFAGARAFPLSATADNTAQTERDGRPITYEHCRSYLLSFFRWHLVPPNRNLNLSGTSGLHSRIIRRRSSHKHSRSGRPRGLFFRSGTVPTAYPSRFSARRYTAEPRSLTTDADSIHVYRVEPYSPPVLPRQKGPPYRRVLCAAVVDEKHFENARSYGTQPRVCRVLRSRRRVDLARRRRGAAQLGHAKRTKRPAAHLSDAFIV